MSKYMQKYIDIKRKVKNEKPKVQNNGKRKATAVFAIFAMAIMLVAPVTVDAATVSWPTSWTTPSQCAIDPVNDENPANADLIGDNTNAAVGFADDSDFRYFRERIDGDPSGPGGFAQVAWVVLFQTSTPKYQSDLR